MALVEDQIWFLAPTRWPTIVYNSNSRGSNALFDLYEYCLDVVYTHTHMLINLYISHTQALTRTHKIKKSWPGGLKAHSFNPST